MRKQNLMLAVAAAALAVGISAARAADVEAAPPAEESTFYVSLFGGASFLEDVDTTQHYADGTQYDYTNEFKTGYVLGGAIGARLWDPVRADVEVSYARWKADEYRYDGSGGSSSSGNSSGHVSATYLLGNLWLDIDTGSSFTPYVGGGAGVAWVDADEVNGDLPWGFADGEMGFAFQAGAGVQVAITDNIAVDLGYRFKGILDIDFDGRPNPGVVGGVIPSYDGGDLYSHNVQAGVVFKF